MPADIRSGAGNASVNTPIYTNNTSQNVRVIINYMANVTSMSWSSSSGGTVNVTAEATTIGKDIQNITGEFRGAEAGATIRIENASTNRRTIIRELKLGDKKLTLRNYSSSYSFEPAKSEQAETGDLTNIRSNSELFSSENFYSSNFWFPVGPGGYGSAELGSGRERSSANIFYVPLTVSRGGNFPVELMLSSGQSFSAVCGAYNIVAIREDGN